MLRVKILVICAVLSLPLFAESVVGPNLFLANSGYLYGRSETGSLAYYTFSPSGQLMFGKFTVPEDHPAIDGILAFYCKNLARTFQMLQRVRLLAAQLDRKDTPENRQCRADAQKLLDRLGNGRLARALRAELKVPPPRMEAGQSATATATASSKTVPPAEGVSSSQTVGVSQAPPAPPTQTATTSTPPASMAAEIPPQKPPTPGDAHTTPDATPAMPPKPTNRPLAVDSAGAPLFCSNPVKAVCDKAKERNQYEALARQSYGRQIMDAAKVTPELLNSSDPAVRLRSWQAYLTALRAAIKPQQDAYYAETERIKAEMSIRFERDPTLTPQKKKLIQARIAEKYFNFMTRDDFIDIARVDYLRKECGPDLLSAAGFTIGKAVALCPVFLTPLTTEDYRWYVTVHETMHSVDSRNDPAMFALFEDCLKRVDLKGAKPGTQPGERTADLLAGEVFAQKMSRETPEKIIETLAGALGGYCSNFTKLPASIGFSPTEQKAVEADYKKNQSDHPESEFQLDFLFSRNPLIHEKICGSKFSEARPYCGRSGKNVYQG